VLSLGTAVVFNGLQVRHAAEQTRLSRQTAQLQLVTSLGLRYEKARNEGTNTVSAHKLLERRARVSHGSALYKPMQTELLLAEQYAYVVNHRYIDLPDAVPPGPLVCTWRWLLALLPRSQAHYIYTTHDSPELERFAKSHPGEYACAEPSSP